MRKSLILVLTAIGSGASYAAGVTEVATRPQYGRPVHVALAGELHSGEPEDAASRPIATVGALDAELVRPTLRALYAARAAESAEQFQVVRRPSQSVA